MPVEYRLAPAATVDGIVDDARRAVAWFHAHAAEYGCDPAAIHVAGNSAGGHLTGMLAAEGWQAEWSLPADVIASAAPVSGLFDLAPLRRTFANDWLALDDAGARRNSPIHRPPRAGHAGRRRLGRKGNRRRSAASPKPMRTSAGRPAPP